MSEVELSKSIAKLQKEETELIKEIQDTTDPKKTGELSKELVEVRGELKELEEIEEQIAMGYR